VLDDLDDIYKSLEQVPAMYTLDSELFIPLLKVGFPDLIRGIERNQKHYHGDFFRSVKFIAEERHKERNEFMDYIDEVIGPVIDKDDLDYRKLQLLRYTDGLAFFNLYSRKLMIYLTNQLIDDPAIVSPVDQLDEKFIKDSVNQLTFTMVMRSLAYDIKYIKDAMVSIGHIQFDPDTHDMVMAERSKTVDPIGQAMIPGIGDLVHAVGKMYNMWVKGRRDLAQEEVERLRIQVVLLNRKLDSTTTKEESAKLVRQIEYYNNRINKISAKMDALVED